MENNGLRLIIFCDLVGSSEVANEIHPESYANEYVKSFYFAGEAAINFVKSIDKNWNISNKDEIECIYSGDEMLILKRIENIKCCTDDIITALSFAYTLKLYWLLSPYTVRKICDKKPPREIACGIHIGDVVEVESSATSDAFTSYASYDINIAKRVEGVSRKGISSNVYVTNFLAEIFNKWRKKELQQRIRIDNLRLLTCTGFKTATAERLKGIAGNVYVSELLPNFKGKDNNLNLLDILDFIKDKSTHSKTYEMLSECIAIFFKQQENNKWGFTEFPLQNEIDNYLENIFYLSKCSANLWFNFNTLYITSALVKYAEDNNIQIADISQDITEMCDDLKEKIKESIKKED